MSTGDKLARSFTVRVDGDLVSGTRIISDIVSLRWTGDVAGLSS